jgi:hypothetical protein
MIENIVDTIIKISKGINHNSIGTDMIELLTNVIDVVDKVAFI